MNRRFVKHEFDKIIAKCEEIHVFDQPYSGDNPRHPNTTFIRERKYRLNGRTVAVIIYYTHKDGQVTKSIRMLLIDDQPYNAVELPPL